MFSTDKKGVFHPLFTKSTFLHEVKCRKVQSVFEVSEMDSGVVCFSEYMPGQYDVFFVVCVDK